MEKEWIRKEKVDNAVATSDANDGDDDDDEHDDEEEEEK